MKENGLFCLDWQAAQIELYGSWRTHPSYQALDVSVVPCNFKPNKNDTIGGPADWNDRECNDDYEKAMEYLTSTVYMTTFYNSGSF